VEDQRNAIYKTQDWIVGDLRYTTGVIAEKDDAIIVAFAGTDPGVWETLATDFDIRPIGGQNTHGGFQAAADAAQDRVRHAIDRSQATSRPLFITGHSLGAALAALASQFAAQSHAPPKAVYAFGMPRVGGESFCNDYNDVLGSITYRFVHGLDVVARIPTSAIGFRHVGRFVHCESHTKFDLSRLTATATDDPEYALGLAHTLVSGVEGFFSGHIFSPPGPGTFGPFFKFLPQPIRDHLQDCYYDALS
jgi:predicted lipase